MNPITANPTATALQIWRNSIPCVNKSPEVIRVGTNLSVKVLCNVPKTRTAHNWDLTLYSGITVNTWFPSWTNCWGTSMNSRILSDMMKERNKERMNQLSHATRLKFHQLGTQTQRSEFVLWSLPVNSPYLLVPHECPFELGFLESAFYDQIRSPVHASIAILIHPPTSLPQSDDIWHRWKLISKTQL